ncbi:hypothetical protein [Sansalvadorimonas verongulae]|uniref:hypothetical protein n=1 Tax=Sansalvadorimonas verongulae TaxID=2172824 RepID=UPI0012BBD304|nr:hypothetical protein [Sansalvadorimonas verongulae]MTI12793.1 hypothetical protein [Sansalvadorimonas verongulae]
MKLSINTITSVQNLSKDEANVQAWRGWEVQDIEWNSEALQRVFSGEWMASLAVGRKRKEDMVGISALYLDIDDKTCHGDDILEVVHEKLVAENISHAIAPSAHHMKPKTKKSGEVLPPCPRLKIMIPMDEVLDITDSETMATWQASKTNILTHFADMFGIALKKMDGSSLDVNRYNYRCNPYRPEWKFFTGSDFDITPLAVEPPEPEPVKYSNYSNYSNDGNYSGNDDHIEDAARYFFSMHRDRSEWVTMCLAVANVLGVGTLATMTNTTKAELASFTKGTTGRIAGKGTIIHLAKQHGWDAKRSSFYRFIEEYSPTKKRKRLPPSNLDVCEDHPVDDDTFTHDPDYWINRVEPEY